MAILTVIKANNTTVELPSPKSMTWTISDLDESAERNQNGEVFRDRIAIKRKLQCEWPPLDKTQMSNLLNAVSDVFFTLRYPDAQTGAFRDMTCYVGDRTTPMLVMKSNSNWLWDSVGMSFVEK